MSARAKSFNGVDNQQGAEEGPDEPAKSNGGLEGTAEVVGAAVPRSADGDGERDGSGKPEDGGHGFEGERSKSVEDAGEVERGEADVGEHQEGPDAVEEHEVDGRG